MPTRNSKTAVSKSQSKRTPTKQQYSKRLVSDIRALLWVVTVGVLLLSALCIVLGYVGSLPWLTAMVGLPWTAHGAVCTAYLNVTKSDHKRGGITYDAAAATGFQPSPPAVSDVSDSDTDRSPSAPTI